jgi:hypothetical protein
VTLPAAAVLVEFNSAKKARKFVERVNGSYGLPSIEAHARGIKVTGLWKLPRKFCECGSQGIDINGFTRGEKYGWWVHAACGRPSSFWVKAKHRFWSGFGKNLLPGAEYDAGKPNLTPTHSEDHDNLVMRQVLPSVGADLVPERMRKLRKKKTRPRRGDGTVAGH